MCFINATRIEIFFWGESIFFFGWRCAYISTGPYSCTFLLGGRGEAGGAGRARGKGNRGYVLECLYDIIYFVALCHVCVCIGMDPKKNINCPVPPSFFVF